MRYAATISIVAALTLALTSMSVSAGQGRGGGSKPGATRPPPMQQDRIPDRDRTRDQTQLEEPDRDRTRDQTRLEDPDRDRDRIHQKDATQIKDGDIYGGALMTEEERNQYRKQISEAKSEQAREQIQSRHEQAMRDRAMQQGKDLVPPGQGPIYGGELMSVQERNEYREQLRLSGSQEERTKLQAQHREKMEQRADALKLDVEEAE